MRWLFAFTLFSLTSAHSWLDCTNWIPNNQDNPGFSNSQGTCAGWARRFEINPDKGFGKHDEIQFFRMFDQRGAGMAPCRNQPSTAAGGSHEIRGTPVESMYSPNKNQYGQTYYPIGTVQAGQRVCWRWPAKNHVPHAQIPNDIEVNFANRPNYEPATQAEWSSMKIATANFKDSCPTPFDVLPGNDQTGVGSERRACGTCFTVPANFVAGTYSIQWRWIASATAIYTSCGDVRVTAQPPPPPPPPAQAQESLTFVSAPTTMDARATSTLRLRYNTPVARQLVVDLLRDNTYQWYGKSAVAVPAGSGDINLQFKPQIMPPNGGGLFFSAFLTTTQAWATNQGEAWKSATRYARSNIQITGSLVPAGADADVKEKIALMLDGVPSVIATAATSFDVGVALTTTGARSIMIELVSSDKKTSYASVKFPVRQGVSSNFMLPIPITKSLPVIYDNTSSIISDGVGLTLFVHLYNGNQLLSSDNKTITATGTTTLYPVEEKIAFVTDANGAIHSTFKAGSSVEILVSYAAAASRTIWLRLIDSATGTTAVESSADVQGGRGSVRLSWQLPTTLTLNSRYQLQARLIDSMIFRVNKAAIENDMGVATTIDITIGTASQTRVITPENAGNSTIIENAASAPSTYDDVIGSSSTSDASTITMSFFTILLISFLAIQW